MFTPSHAPPSHPASAAGRATRVLSALWALVVASFWLVWMGLLTARFMVRHGRLARASLADLVRFLRDPPAPALPLRAVSPGVLAPVADDTAAADGLVVMCFTGTGESPSAMYEDIARLTRDEPRLRSAPHYVLEAPESAGAYLDARAFGEAMWERAQTVVARHAGPFVLIGMSRGGVAALDCGMRIVDEQGKVAAVLALSAPLDVPAELPTIVCALAGLEHSLGCYADTLGRTPRFFTTLSARSVWLSHLWYAALIIRDLRMPVARHLQHVRSDLEARGTVQGSLRSAREFRLLQRVDLREAEWFANDLVESAARSVRLFVAAAWGVTDHWVNSDASISRLRRALHREPRALAQIVSDLLPAQGHALFREETADAQPVRLLLQRVVREAIDRAGQHMDRRRFAAELELRARTDDLGFGDGDG